MGPKRLVPSSWWLVSKAVPRWIRNSDAAAPAAAAALLFPMADAFVAKHTYIRTIQTRDDATTTRRKRQQSLGFFIDNSNNNNNNEHEQTRGFPFSQSVWSSLSAVVVPELDDMFPEDYENNNNNSTQGDPPPPPPQDYFSGADDFQLGDLPPSSSLDAGSGYEKQETEPVINPFPFPEPTFSYTEDGPSSSSNNNHQRYEKPRVSLPEPILPKNSQDCADTADLDGAVKRLKDGDLDRSISRPTKNRKQGIEFGSNSLPNDDAPSKETGRRTMATMATDATDDSTNAEDQESVEKYDLWQPLELEAPTTGEQVDDDTTFAPFSSIMDDDGSRPIKPLVAPLKLPKASKIATATTTKPNAASDVSVVPSIEANGLDDLVDSLQGQLKSVQKEIEVMAGDQAKSINLNSPKQISQLLFGRPDMSTNKSTLEGMAASNVLAKLVLEYREAKRKLNKVLRQQEARNASSSNSEASSSGANTLSSPAPPKPMKDPVLLFDTSSFIFRAYYSNPPIHRGRDGMPTGAVMGFCSMLNKLLLTSMLNGETPILIHCLDAPGSSFRNELYPDYKAHRPPIPLDLVPQFNLINRAVKAYGMIQIQAPGFEADDVIATLATVGSQTEGLDVKILSGDKDLMQLVTEDDDDDDDSKSTGMVHMVDPMTSKVWNHEMVREKWGVGASQLGDVLALAGDAADNVPGVPGIGPKIAAQLLQEFGSLESLLDNTDRIPQPKRREKLETNVESARISRELVELQRGLEWSQMEAFHPPSTNDGDDDTTAVPMPESTKISDLRMQPIQVDRILAFYDDMGFHKLKTQLLDRLGKIQPPIGQSGGDDDDTKDDESPASPTKPPSTPLASAKPTAPAAAERAKTKPKARPKRNYWEKTKRTVPKPEEFKDVPF